jgi:DNA-binding PadR family transcriptional regulator
MTRRDYEVLRLFIGGAELYGRGILGKCNSDIPMGSLYMILARLRKAGYLRTWISLAKRHEKGGNRRRYYKLTPKGREEILRNREI